MPVPTSIPGHRAISRPPQAHNHNADLLKHHKEAIDQVQNRRSERSPRRPLLRGMVDVPPDPELDQVHSQLLKVDEVLQHEMAKEVRSNIDPI